MLPTTRAIAMTISLDMVFPPNERAGSHKRSVAQRKDYLAARASSTGRVGNMGLRAKFNLALLAAFVIGFVVAAMVLYRIVYDNAREQVLQNARIMMAAADGIRSYTSTNLVPLLPQERDGKFVAETVPAFAAQRNFKQLQDAYAGLMY